jgi:hypothetical protein
MANDQLVPAWEAGADHPAGEIRLTSMPAMAARARLLSGHRGSALSWLDNGWTVSSTTK